MRLGHVCGRWGHRRSARLVGHRIVRGGRAQKRTWVEAHQFCLEASIDMISWQGHTSRQVRQQMPSSISEKRVCFRTGIFAVGQQGINRHTTVAPFFIRRHLETRQDLDLCVF